MNENGEQVVIHGLVCPRPLTHEDTIVLGHGSGGKMTQDLILRSFYPPFENPTLLRGNDAAVVSPPNTGGLAISTDSHIVSPLFFPGGDIGSLAVCGTVNDLAMVGAQPLWLTAGFIIEEGLPIFVLEQAVESMKIAAEEAGVIIIAGDTKVTERGKADGLFITTSGVGWVPQDREVEGANAKPGDVVILSGSLGDHGIAVLAARGELAFESEIESDIAPLNGLVEAMFQVSSSIHVLRDPTRGGLATTLNEIARQSQVTITLDEDAIPVRPEVEAACEMLGFDPLYVANEGKLVAILPAQDADAVLDAIKKVPYGSHACRIGEVQESPAGRVLMRTSIGGTRVVDVLAGEMLPRIC
ncbi:MAG: hydrogenase expression/formation protein HypE [Anaerolineales bacterium]|nr:hydrogenase expression/formation protein HypE [Anaerolineales bacterium]